MISNKFLLTLFISNLIMNSSQQTQKGNEMNWQQRYSNQDKWPNVPFITDRPARCGTLCLAVTAAFLVAVDVILILALT